MLLPETTVNQSRPRSAQLPIRWRTRFLGIVVPAIASTAAVTAAGLLTSCIPAFYQAKSDAEVYGVLQKLRAKHKIGTADNFSIDTPDSDKKPDEIAVNDVLIERSNWGEKILGIKDAIELGRKSSRVFQSNKENLYLAALTYTGERHQFRPQFFAGSTATRTWIPETRTIERRVEVPVGPTAATNGAVAAANAVIGAAAPGATETITVTEEQRFWEQRGTVVSQAGVNQALSTGADIGINIVNDLLRFYTGDPRKAAATTLQANIIQPIFRGSGRGIATERLKQAYRNVVYETRTFSHFENTFSADIVIAYYRLLQQKDTLYNQYANYLSRSKTTAYLAARAVDRESPLDVKQAEQAELEAKNSYIDAVVRFRSELDNFKITLGLPQTTDLRLEDVAMEQLQETELAPFYLDSQDGFSIALKYRLPLMNAIGQFEDSRRAVRVAADALEPGLSFFADAALTSEGPLNYQDFDIRDLRANAGLALDLPINKKLERNAYRATLIRFEQELRALGLAFDELRNTIDQGIRQIQQFRQNYIIQKGAVDLAETRVEGEELNLQAGEAILLNLQDAQDSLISAQNQRTAALVDYMGARLNLLIELGILNTEVDNYWLSPTASIIDLSQAPPNALPDAFLEGEEVLPPEILFPKD
jgi:outer membrane protein TolC